MRRHHIESSAPLLTIAEYAVLDEVEDGYAELHEGRLLMSPSPTPEHQLAMFTLGSLIHEQLPAHLALVLEVDIDLELAEPGQPGFSRRPDMIVVARAELARRKAEGGLLRASEVPLVIEIISPRSKRIDRVVKYELYADAGIPHYWIVDLNDPASLLPMHLTDRFGYQRDDEVTDVFTANLPFPVTIDLKELY
ncbi:Uma2 family endonuclease [Actinokineospora inagensis]|uniref:Uma2 family endonuclease n=1 Tax=Actinokineospora inagensis TaxID=103730 RepID=UPI00047AA4D2|nr:Uma2 family endonuclease [Actinokineospora inagensis]